MEGILYVRSLVDQLVESIPSKTVDDMYTEYLIKSISSISIASFKKHELKWVVLNKLFKVKKVRDCIPNELATKELSIMMDVSTDVLNRSLMSAQTKLGSPKLMSRERKDSIVYSFREITYTYEENVFHDPSSNK